MFDIAADGSWHLIDTTATAPNPSYLITDSEERTLYAAHGDGSWVSALRIDANTGRLRVLEHYDTGGTNVVHLALSPDERHLVAANYATGSVAVFRRRSDGRLAARTQLLDLTGQPGPVHSDQTGPHPHEVRFDSSGTHIVVPDKGTDRLHRLRYTASSGWLSELGPPVRAAPGAGPRHLVYHPRLPMVYVVDELSSHLGVCGYDAGSANLTLVQRVSTLRASSPVRTQRRRSSSIATRDLFTCPTAVTSRWPRTRSRPQVLWAPRSSPRCRVVSRDS